MRSPQTACKHEPEKSGKNELSPVGEIRRTKALKPVFCWLNVEGLFIAVNFEVECFFLHWLTQRFDCHSIIQLLQSFLFDFSGVPKCFGVTSLMEGDTPELKCNSTFFGVLSAGKMQWVRREVTSGNDDEVGVASRDLFDTRLAERSVRVAPVTRFDDGTTFTCRMTLDDVTECQLVLSVACKSFKHSRRLPGVFFTGPLCKLLQQCYR